MTHAIPPLWRGSFSLVPNEGITSTHLPLKIWLDKITGTNEQITITSSRTNHLSPHLQKKDSSGRFFVAIEITVGTKGMLFGGSNPVFRPTNDKDLPAITLGLHPDTGLPYIPGTSLKGMICSVVERIEDTSKSKGSAENKTGTQGSSPAKQKNVNEANNFVVNHGRIHDVFHGVFPLKITISANKDHLTPHSNPLHNPVPLGMIKVDSGSTMKAAFHVVAKNQGEAESKVEHWLTELQFFGMGARTNYGYGQFYFERSSIPSQAEIPSSSENRNQTSPIASISPTSIASPNTVISKETEIDQNVKRMILAIAEDILTEFVDKEAHPMSNLNKSKHSYSSLMKVYSNMYPECADQVIIAFNTMHKANVFHYKNINTYNTTSRLLAFKGIQFRQFIESQTPDTPPSP